MIRLVYSNQIETLAEALARDLAATRTADPVVRLFEPTWIIVPNRAVATWLKLQLATCFGVAGNLQLVGLVRFVREMTRAKPLEIVTTDAVQSVVAGLLADADLLSQDVFTNVARYLGSGEVSRNVQDTRRVQLAGELAQLFEGYRFTRPEVIAGWAQRPFFDQAPAIAALELWQRELWARVLTVFHAAAEPWVLPETLLADHHETLDLPAHIFVFGLSQVSPTDRNLLVQLSERTHLSKYVLNPCMEFWEDVEPRWRHPDLQARFEPRQQVSVSLDDEDPFGLQRPDDTPMLQLWGRPGRESTRLLNAATACDFDARFVDPCEPRTTVLTALQRDTLLREPPREGVTALQLADDSVSMLACPSIQREVEIVAARIWGCLADDQAAGSNPPLRFNDIAVLVPTGRRQAYLTRIQTVFADVHDIPHNVIDLGVGSQSRFFEAVMLLLELPFGEFRRPELLALITHPNIRHGHEVHDGDLWASWCDALGIVHGADHSDHAGTYIDQDVFNWEQGLKRLVLGAFMETETLDRLLVDVPVSGPEQTRAYRPHDVPPDRHGSLIAFRRLVHGLTRLAQESRRRERSLAGWAQWAARAAGQWLEPVTDADRRVRDRCLEAFEDIVQLDVTGRKMRYREAFTFLADRLSGIDVQRGQYLADGVVVAALRPMRALPFRHVFMVGMGEGNFPSADRMHPLDLRAVKRRAGDVTPRELDMYAFLETILATRDKLTLSWVDRDEQTGEAIAASTVVSELETILRRGYWTVTAADAALERHPLRRYDPAYFPELFGADAHTLPPLQSADAVLEARVSALRTSIQAWQSATGRASPITNALLDGVLTDSDRVRLDAVLASPPLPEKTTTIPGTVSVSLAALRRFLESPLQGAARDLLRMSQFGIEDLLAIEDEVFESGGRRRRALLHDVFLEALHRPGGLQGSELQAIYDARIRSLALSGHHPIGPFGAAQRFRDVRRTLVGWRGHAQRLDLPNRGRLRRVIFGQAVAGAGADILGRGPSAFAVAESHPPFVLDVQVGGQTVWVELHGTTAPLMADGDPPTIVSLVERDGVRDHDFLGGFVDAMAMGAAGLGPELGFSLLVLSTRPTRDGAFLVPLALRAPDAAQRWLRTVVADFLGGRHDYLLPIEAACESRLEERAHPRPLADIIRSKRDDTWNRVRAHFGPIRDISQYEPPPDPDSIVTRRLSAFLSDMRQKQPAWSGR